MSSSVTISDLVGEAITYRLSLVRKVRPGIIESYDKDSNTCSVRPLLGQKLEDGEGAYVTTELALLENVPVLQLRGGKVSLTIVPERGDKVTLLFCDRSMDKLLTTGQADVPEELRQHDLMDAMVLPAFFTFNDPPPDAGTASIGAESKPGKPGLRIHFTEGTLYLGDAGATEAVLLGTTYRSADQTFDNSLSSAAATLTTAATTLGTAATTLGTAMTAAGAAPAPAASVGTFATAMGTFASALATFTAAVKAAADTKEGGASGFLSQTVKVKA